MPVPFSRLSIVGRLEGSTAGRSARAVALDYAGAFRAPELALVRLAAAALALLEEPDRAAAVAPFGLAPVADDPGWHDDALHPLRLLIAWAGLTERKRLLVALWRELPDAERRAFLARVAPAGRAAA